MAETVDEELSSDLGWALEMFGKYKKSEGCIRRLWRISGPEMIVMQMVFVFAHSKTGFPIAV